MEIQRKSLSSWVYDIKISDSSFLGRKRVDYTTFSTGITIAKKYNERFLKCLSKPINNGDILRVKLLVEGKEFNGVIRCSSSKRGKVIKLIYSEKALHELLKSTLSISYDYIIKYIYENEKRPNIIPEKYAEFLDFYKGENLDEFIIRLIPSETKVLDDEEITYKEYEDNKPYKEIEGDFIDTKDVNKEIDYIHKFIKSKGFEYSKELIKNFYLCLKTKPFVILSGISGTGKSKMVQLFAEAMGANYSNNRFKMIPVKPEWSDSTDLLGYRNIEGKFIPGIITSIAYDAIKNPKFPYFICLDEMNLARVEYYFSDILSLMETRKMKENSNIVTEKLLNKEQFGTDRESFEKYKDVYIPENLYIVGTVNMDETTFPFSKKVLDRANVIEFNKVNLYYDFEDTSSKKEECWIYDNEFLKSEFLKIADCKEYKDIALKVIDELVKINSILERYNKQFGLRIRDEIVFYMIYALKDKVMDFNKALDYCILQKILPKISGSDIEVFDILIKLFNLFNNTKYDINLEKEQLKEMNKEVNSSKYKLTSEKLINMIRRFIENGFTTFWN